MPTARRAGPAQAAGAGVRLFLRVRPGARRTGLDGWAREADGRARLGVAVTAAPEGGRANDAVIALLARRWRLPKRAFSVTAGAGARLKTVLISGDAATILARIQADPDADERS